MKNLIYTSILLSFILISCKSTASSTSSNDGNTTKSEQTQTSKSAKNESASEQPASQEVKDPKGLSTKSPAANTSTPVKKYPSSGD